MWQLAGNTIESRLLMGTANFPSLEVLSQAIEASQSQIVTVSLKREYTHDLQGQRFWEMLQKTGRDVLPNTAGCQTAKEAITIACMARDIFNTHWIKLEVIGDVALLAPEPFELVKAAKTLNRMGFVVFPFCTDDLLLCQKLYDVGCNILMPWGSPIGSGKGLLNPFALSIIRERFPESTLIIDAGIGTPVHAMQAMLLGYDGVLVNSAIACAHDPVNMAKAFYYAVEGGHCAFHAGVMVESDTAIASTPLSQTLFWSHA